jgi:hypothetical protein
LIENTFPGRRVLVISGTIDIKKRKELIDSIKNDHNTILLSTQQSLSSSLNIGFIDKVIITRLPWNLASLSQYYFRFCRFDSKNFKTINIVTYQNSLESNLLRLICAKENLVRFTKNLDQLDTSLENELGIDFDLISMLLTKEKDINGRTYINWNS